MCGGGRGRAGAQVAELADALASGASDRKVVEVRVFSWAPAGRWFPSPNRRAARAVTVHLHRFDLPAGVSFAGDIAVDTETRGLRHHRDRLCVVQLSAGDGDAHLVHFPEPDYAAPNLRRALGDEDRAKIFHYARFDVAALRRAFGIVCRPVYCTRIASRLARTYTDRHGLKDLAGELLGVALSKEQQSSDWAAAELSAAQRAYAAADVLYLHRLRERLDTMLARDGRADLAAACFAFVPVRAALDLAGWADEDIFAH